MDSSPQQVAEDEAKDSATDQNRNWMVPVDPESCGTAFIVATYSLKALWLSAGETPQRSDLRFFCLSLFTRQVMF